MGFPAGIVQFFLSSICLILLLPYDTAVMGFSTQQQQQQQHLSINTKTPPSRPNLLQLYSCNRRTAIIQSTMVATSALLVGSPRPANAAYIDPNSLKVTSRVYLDVQLPNEESSHRIVIGLFGEAMPRAAENFRKLCADSSYAGSTFYRVIGDITVQGGAIGDDTGKTGTSSYENGAPFEPDNFNILHNRSGLVSMVRGVGGGVDSRFFINMAEDSGWADDRYAAFGVVEVEDGSMDIVHKIEKVKVKPPQNRPIVPVEIVASGVLS
jgi:peptidyl-prolyl cis-trans isomerase B (cyclophilin B)